MLGDLGRLIDSDYREYVQITPMNSDLKEALLRQERVPSFLNNLIKELSRVKKLTREQIKLVTYDMTQLFISQVTRMANEKHMSDATRAAKQKEIDDKANLEKIADEWADGKRNFTDLEDEIIRQS